MAESLDEKKELIILASRIVMLVLLIITSALFIGFGMTGTTLVDTWVWFTIGACSEWILEKPLSSVVTGIRNRFAKKGGGT